MEEFQKARDRAKRSLEIADHMLTQTFPLVNDPRLLLAVIENIMSALKSGIDAILLNERLFKKIPPYHNSFEGKMEVFIARCTRRYNFPKSYIDLIRNVQDLIEDHKKSSVEFSRRNRLVMCNDDYNLKEINTDKLRKYLDESKLFLRDIEKAVSKNEGLFK